MTRKIDDLIIATQKKLKVTSVVVTHDMESACLVADRIAMLYEGEIVAMEKPDVFRRMKDPRVREFLGSFAIEAEEDGHVK